MTSSPPRTGRIFRYDVTGGRWEDEDYYATGSGGKDARGSLKKRYRAEMDAGTAVDVLVGPSTTPPTRTPGPAGRTWSAASSR